MGTVRQKFVSSGVEDVQRDLVKLQRQTDKLGEANKKLAQEAKKANQTARRGTRETTTSTRDLARTVGRAVTAYAGFGQAVRVVNSNLREQIELQNRAKQTQQTLGQARAGTILNLAGVSEKQVREILARQDKIVRETRVPAAVLERALAGGLSAVGDPSKAPRVQSAIRVGAQILRSQPEGIQSFTEANITVGRIAGVKDAAAVAGFQLQAGRAVRVTDPALFARNVPPALVSVSQSDTSGDKRRAVRQGIGLFAALGLGGEDPTGASTATSAISLNQQLSQRVGGFETLGQRVRAVQADPKLQFRLFDPTSRDRLTLEKRFIGAAKALLTDPNSIEAKAFRDSKNLRFDPETFNVTRQRLKDIDSTRILTTATEEARGNVQNFDLGNIPGGRTAVVRDVLKGAFKANTGFFNNASDVLERGFFEASMAVGRDPVAVGTDILSKLKTATLRSGGLRTIRDKSELSAAEQRLIELTEQQLRVLENMERRGQANAANAEFARDPE